MAAYSAADLLLRLMADPVVPRRMELWELARLRPYEKNARTHSQEQIDQIARSIQEFGFTNPILVAPDDGIIAGHGRLQAAQQLRLNRVPVIVLEHLTEEQRKAYVLADNQLALNAGWDLELLREEVGDLDGSGFDLELLGFSDEFLGELLEDLGEDQGEDESPYSSKADAPVYEPSMSEPPPVEDLADVAKCQEILARIYATDGIPDILQGFLVMAAYRHVVFNFQAIAEFYAHADEKVRGLMRDSALVIVDTEKAFAEGWLRLGEELREIYAADAKEQGHE